MSLKLGNTTISGISRETKLNAHSLLDFKWTDHILNEMSWLRADTFSWQSGDVYTSVYNLLVSEYQNGTEETEGSITFKRSTNGYKITTDESAVSTLFNESGVAWYYILDTTNKRFKLPRTKFGFTGLRDGVGNYVAESLPNITANWNSAQYDGGWGTPEGAVYGVKNNSPEYNSGSAGMRAYFDASRCSSTYKNGAPVQERATQMYLYFYVGEFSQTATEQTAGITTEMFNNKVDKTDLSTVHCVISTYVNGTSGYRIYDDGCCEQWGQGTFGSGGYDIVLPKKYKDTNYNVVSTFFSMSTGYGTGGCTGTLISKKSENTIYIDQQSHANRTTLWRTYGYLAEGQY